MFEKDSSDKDHTPTPRVILRNGSNTRPVVQLLQENGNRAVIKDFRKNGFFFRHTVGRFLIWREGRAYRMLEEVRGVPEFYGVVDGLALMVEEIPGVSLQNLPRGSRLPEGFFNRLSETLEECHRRGLAHCDLKRRGNVLLGQDGTPYVVDWAASVSEKELGFFPLDLIYRRFLLDDEMAVTKLRLRYEPDSVSAEERERYEHRSLAERVIRSIRDRLRSFLQKIA